MIEPLFEHRRMFARRATRVLELEGDGPPLVLVHGYADSADSWRQTLDRLARVAGVAPPGLEMTRLLSLVQRDPVLRSVVALPTPSPPLCCVPRWPGCTVSWRSPRRTGSTPR